MKTLCDGASRVIGVITGMGGINHPVPEPGTPGKKGIFHQGK